ncbi:hypothetical protein NA56DRAFT_701006 [Hyaloscypha hepaticicola]|uniref:Uncharacterized protein n=1 Tax=Hyaloscypha hepaticicola TaxID=2082293 RepID=A0A2J6QBG4_9HELO|nr:hypothetical protein NA56DRAFT_701006 [Hyaloscypha hepaticicola]
MPANSQSGSQHDLNDNDTTTLAEDSIDQTAGDSEFMHGVIGVSIRTSSSETSHASRRTWNGNDGAWQKHVYLEAFGGLSRVINTSSLTMCSDSTCKNLCIQWHTAIGIGHQMGRFFMDPARTLVTVSRPGTSSVTKMYRSSFSTISIGAVADGRNHIGM